MQLYPRNLPRFKFSAHGPRDGDFAWINSWHVHNYLLYLIEA